MIDIGTVKKYGNAVISLDGKNVYADRLITDPEEKTIAKVASLLYEDAMIEYYLEKNGAGISIDAMIESEIKKYSLDHTPSSSEEAKVIEKILHSTGSITLDLRDESTLKGSRFLERTEKGRGLAILEYRALEEGFAIENLQMKNNGTQLEITFTKRMKKDSIDNSSASKKTVFDLQGREKIDYATAELAKSRASKDEVMSKYWQDIIDNLTSKLPSTSKTSVPQTNSSNERAIGSSAEVDSSNPSNVSLEDRQDYATNCFKEAVDRGKEEEANFWQSVMDGLDKEAKIHSKEMFIRKLYKNYEDARRRGDEAIIALYRKDIQNELSKEPLSVTPEEWQEMDNSLKKRYMEMKKIDADTANKPEEFAYWDKTLERFESELLLTGQKY